MLLVAALVSGGCSGDGRAGDGPVDAGPLDGASDGGGGDAPKDPNEPDGAADDAEGPTRFLGIELAPRARVTLKLATAVGVSPVRIREVGPSLLASVDGDAVVVDALRGARGASHVVVDTVDGEATRLDVVFASNPWAFLDGRPLATVVANSNEPGASFESWALVDDVMYGTRFTDQGASAFTMDDDVGLREPTGFMLGRGLADDGTVLAQYLHDTRFQFIGFTWKDGVYGRTCDVGDGLGDCTPESITADGTIVGTTYDYTVYTGFIWPEGGERMPLSLDGYASTYAYDIAPDGTVVGVGDDSSDGYSGPSRCFVGQPDSLGVMPFTDGDPHFVSCRAINGSGVIVGGVKPLADEAGVPRSVTDRLRAAIWHPDAGFAYVAFPIERPSAEAWRVELLLGLNDDGVLVGYLQDATLIPANGDEEERTERVTRGITLTPVEALPGTAFEDSEFDHVNGPI